MSLVAAFLWHKSPRPSISTMILEDEEMQILVAPRKRYCPKSYLSFRKTAKEEIQNFFNDVKRLQKVHARPVILEFKIVFHAHDIPYLMPAKESRFVHTTFIKMVRKLKKQIKHVTVRPQLRSKLSGKSLKQFKQGLQRLHVVRRKRDTGFEYHLWTVALHATSTTYAEKLERMRKKMLAAMWDEVA